MTTTPPPASGTTGFLRHAAVVSLLTFASRLLGLVRERVLTGVFGSTSPWLNAFYVGFIVPNLFRRLFGEGALTAAFLPHYARLVETDPALARRFASRCVAGLAIFLASLTLLGETGLLLALSLTEGEKTSRALQMAAFMLPYMPLVCGVAFLGAILQVHRRFGPAAGAPVVLNLAMIAAAWVASAALPTQDGDARRGVWLVAASVLVAGVVQILWLAQAVRQSAPLTASGLNDPATAAPTRAMFRTMLPVVLGLGVLQINTLFDILIAYGFAAPAPAHDAAALPIAQLHLPMVGAQEYPIAAGGAVRLTLAQRLYQFPLGVFGIALATAIFPVLARTAAACPNGRPAPSDAEFTQTLRRGLRLAALIGLPASMGLAVLATPTARVIFESGKTTTQDAVFIAAALTGYAAGVWAYMLNQVLVRAFYALDDARTPLIISLALVTFNLGLNLTLIWPLGIAGLAWSTAISATLQLGLLNLTLGRKVERPVDAGVLGSWLRSIALTLAMGAGLWFAMRRIDTTTLSLTACAGLLAAAIGASMVAVFAGAWLLRMPELGWLRRRRPQSAE